MSTRDCEWCVFARPYGGENDNRCSAWDCEFIDRKEAVEAYRRIQALESAPHIDAVAIVRCKDCKWASPNGKVGCALMPFSALDDKHYMFANDYCSYGERSER